MYLFEKNIITFYRFDIINNYLNIFDKFTYESLGKKIYLVKEFIEKINKNFIKNKKNL